MDMRLCERLIPLIPNGKIIVAESGVSDVEVIKTYTLLGQMLFNRRTFMRVPSIEES